MLAADKRRPVAHPAQSIPIAVIAGENVKTCFKPVINCLSDFDGFLTIDLYLVSYPVRALTAKQYRTDVTTITTRSVIGTPMILNKAESLYSDCVPAEFERPQSRAA